MKLADLIKAQQADLPITVRHERWLLANVDPDYSEAAIQFSDDFLRGKVGGHRDRQPAFRASGLGKCFRARVYARLGVPGVAQQYSSAQANIFATGNFYHRKWQMAGLSEGWLVQAEVPLYNPELDFGGTMDGRIYDGSLFELKTINDRGYRWVSTTKEPKDEHVKQVGGYHLLDPSITHASIVYENKNNGEWREFRVPLTEEVVAPAKAELDQLHRAMRNQELPAPKNACLDKTGTEYRQCPFRDVCLDMHKKRVFWPANKEGMAE